ncbi:MAG TPA: 30S ribosomal protein S6 [Anaerolineaceae bacterium]|jgi:small subunit ribosomal protein S6|nr:30S ribosomal protein S6 [Longilinea sp.]HNZ01002.1 30S ribosomal protein S6 [Anaerolineaceae bacterium]HOD43587.1 30S ribosomal protein S6 [Anaerolineaceae bacterium]HOH19453.1 30S ribosomal protein S6 [Anaerolineaceae bacterium]HOU43429.1 30S ribosomal protein S6 [Anaerolineaceae bacterium]
MRQYEVVLILQPELEEAAVTGVLDRVKAWIAELGGSVVKVDNWGKRRMAYLIRKQREGQYYLVVAEMPSSATNELERNLRFLEPVMRHMITVVE